MSNLKISQLPEWTGNTDGFYFPGNNSGETTTYKITKETLFSGGSGTSGTSGSSGSSGTSGINGTNGTSGVSGSSGTSGVSGSSGTSGVNGSSGTSGVSGSSGTSGISGSSGTSGVSGSSGTSGVSGSSGTSGVSGSSGTSGVSGSSGTSGVSGSSGTSGISGTSGTSPAMSGESFTIIEVSNSSTTNGTRLLAAYAAAKTKTPYGNALSASNRYTIVLPPGIYDLGSSQLVLDTNFIDIVGSTTDLGNHQITGNVSGYVSVATNSVELRNLYLLNNSSGNGFIYGGNRPGLILDNIFFGYGSGGAAPWQAVNESDFSGVASRLQGGQFYPTGNGNTPPIGNAGNVSGTLSNIINVGAIADGAFTGFAFGCSGGNISFGGRGYYGASTGFMMNCKGGTYAFRNYPSGIYINCYGGDGAWAGTQTTDLSGTYINCHASSGADAFGTSTTRTLTGTMFFCSKRGASDFAAPTGSGVIRLSIDGNNTITNIP